MLFNVHVVDNIPITIRELRMKARASRNYTNLSDTYRLRKSSKIQVEFLVQNSSKNEMNGGRTELSTLPLFANLGNCQLTSFPPSSSSWEKVFANRRAKCFFDSIVIRRGVLHPQTTIVLKPATERVTIWIINFNATQGYRENTHQAYSYSHYMSFQHASNCDTNDTSESLPWGWNMASK